VVESVLLAGDELTRGTIGEAVGRLGEQARSELADVSTAGGGSGDATDPELRATYDLRYSGQAFELSVEGSLEPEPDELRGAFDRAHEERYGYSDPDAELELVTVRVAAALPGAEPPPAAAGSAEERGTRRVRFGEDVVKATILGAGEAELDGPAIFELPGSTLVVPRGWHARADSDGVVMER
jgi:N-methylhydantoinase A/oxoprolinase/acetone carboxylase beta subunit